MFFSGFDKYSAIKVSNKICWNHWNLRFYNFKIEWGEKKMVPKYWNLPNNDSVLTNRVCCDEWKNFWSEKSVVEKLKFRHSRVKTSLFISFREYNFYNGVTVMYALLMKSSYCSWTYPQLCSKILGALKPRFSLYSLSWWSPPHFMQAGSSLQYFATCPNLQHLNQIKTCMCSSNYTFIRVESRPFFPD